MPRPNVLVVGDPDDPRLARLSTSDDARYAVGRDVAALAPHLATADAVLAWWSAGGALDDVLARAPRVRWVHSIAAGVDRLITPTLAAHPAVLTNSRGVFSRALAEFVLGAVFFFAKDFARMRRAQRARAWDPFEVETIAGKTLGIVGYGDIGRTTGDLARAAGMRVVAYRRRAATTPGEGGAGAGALVVASTAAEVYAVADYVVVATPLTRETHHLVGDAAFDAMKRSTVVVNVGRGPVVDEAALVRALDAGKIRGAALDVFEHEPLAPDSPLWDRENVLVSPHCADRTATWLDEALDVFVANVDRFARGAPLANVVDKSLGY